MRIDPREKSMRKYRLLFVVFFFGLALYGHSAPKGRLFIIGGGSRPESMMKKFVALAEGFKSGKIVVFPMASATPDESGTSQAAEFKKVGAKDAVSFNLTREQALKEENAAILNDAGGVYFTGGDQARVTKVLLGTPIQKKLLEIYENGAVIGGTSAGAAIMSEVMITGDEKRKPEEGHEFETLEAGNIITTPGLGLIKTAIVDQHFATRKRHNRLICLVAEHPKLLGIGIDESTAIIINPDETFDVIGDKDVIVYDPRQASVTVTPGKIIGITGMVMHVLLPGTKYDLKQRKIVEKDGDTSFYSSQRK
jgi:cyanophycinase